MKLFATVDKDGKCVSAGPTLRRAWIFAEDLYKSPCSQLLREGYKEIELHTYDPSKQVVVDRDVYKHISKYVGDVLEEYGGDGFPFDGQLDAANKFLKAGEIKR